MCILLKAIKIPTVIILFCNINFVYALNNINNYNLLGNAKNSDRITQEIKRTKSNSDLKLYQKKLASISNTKTNTKKKTNSNSISSSNYTQTVTMVDINKQVEMLLDLLNSVNTNLNTKINAGMADVFEVSETLPSIDTQIEQVAIYVKGLGKALSILSSQVKRQKQSLDNFIVKNIGKPVTKDSGQLGLVINSMISTRAWLQTINGDKFTVGLGDVIPGYGKVTAINIKENFILTDFDIKIKH